MLYEMPWGETPEAVVISCWGKTLEAASTIEIVGPTTSQGRSARLDGNASLSPLCCLLVSLVLLPIAGADACWDARLDGVGWCSSIAGAAVCCSSRPGCFVAVELLVSLSPCAGLRLKA